MDQELSVITLAARIRSEGDAYEFLEGFRWDNTVVCPHCDGTKVLLINCANGVSRKTRTGSMSERRVWKCRECRGQFSVLSGTIMHRSHIPVRTWVMVLFEMCANKNGLAAREVERKYGLSPKTAWFMVHRIREAMRQEWSSDEGYFPQLHRSIAGTYHNVSHEHLHRYLDEFDFRYRTRHLTDTERMHALVAQLAGKRLSYARLRGDAYVSE